MRLFQPSSSAAAAQPPFRLYLTASTPVFISVSPWAWKPRPPRQVLREKSISTPWQCCPFSDYHMGTTSDTGSSCNASSPRTLRLSHVNRFRKDQIGKFLWSGFSENMRVLPNFMAAANSPSQIKESAPWRDFILPLALISRQIGVAVTVTKETRS